ncbi:MAG: GNAT family N-acetyltransferase [Candidatus Gastranaerophilales bacterium]
MQINNSSTTSFNAIPISTIKISKLGTDFKMYEATKADHAFLSELPERIQISELMPNLSKKDSDRWQEMLQLATDVAQEGENRTFIATSENKPCGILTFVRNNKVMELDCICTWPLETGKKVKCAGQALFKKAFDFVQNQKMKKIELSAITDGPFDNVAKYKRLGFIETGGKDHKIHMETTSQRIKEQLKAMNNLMEETPITHGENENLLDTIL